MTSSKCNETTSFWTHFNENFYGIQFIEVVHPQKLDQRQTFLKKLPFPIF